MQAAGKLYIPYPSRSSEFHLWHLSDLHLMNKGCAEDKIRQDVQAIKKDPYSFWIGGGDYCDYIGYSDKRFDPDAVADYIKVKDLGQLQTIGMKKIKSIFTPIKDKCLGLLFGNHEKCYAVYTQQQDKHGWLCTELGVRNLHYCCLFDIVFHRKPRSKPQLLIKPPGRKSGDAWSVRIFAHHGAGFAQTPGGKLNRLVQFMQSFDANVYFCGHVHDQLGRREPTIGANAACTKLVEHVKIGVISGSYLKTYAQNCTGYGEQRGYRPTVLGAAVIQLKPNEKSFRALV